jgi:hypothetical protein
MIYSKGPRGKFSSNSFSGNGSLIGETILMAVLGFYTLALALEKMF